MNKTTINSLPPQVFKYTLRFLDGTSLFACCTVSKKWKKYADQVIQEGIKQVFNTYPHFAVFPNHKKRNLRIILDSLQERKISTEQLSLSVEQLSQFVRKLIVGQRQKPFEKFVRQYNKAVKMHNKIASRTGRNSKKVLLSPKQQDVLALFVFHSSSIKDCNDRSLKEIFQENQCPGFFKKAIKAFSAPNLSLKLGKRAPLSQLPKKIAVPPQLGFLSNVQKLDLSGGQFTSLPLELRNLQKLNYLNLDQNRLTIVELANLLFIQKTEKVLAFPCLDHLRYQVNGIPQNEADTLKAAILKVKEIDVFCVQQDKSLEEKIAEWESSIL